jgi:hypothetical protein
MGGESPLLSWRETMQSNNQILKQVLKEHDLTRRWAALYLMVNISTIDRWLQPRLIKGVRNTSYRRMPDSAIALLNYRLADEGVSK